MILLINLEILLSRIKHLPWVIKSFKNWDYIIKETINNRFPEKVIMRNGLIIHGDKYHVGLISSLYDIFYLKVYNCYNMNIDNNDIVVDIGANIGVFSLYASQFSKNKIISYEPYPAAIQIFKKNINTNDLNHQIYIHNNAIFNKSGIVKIFINDKWEQNSIYNKFQKQHILIKAITPDEIFTKNDIDRIDFLKIDCEGCEEFIIMNISPIQYSRIKKIAIEYHDNLTSINHKIYERILKNNGFRIGYTNIRGNVGHLLAWKSN